jgi:hypothetical protein
MKLFILICLSFLLIYCQQKSDNQSVKNDTLKLQNQTTLPKIDWEAIKKKSKYQDLKKYEVNYDTGKELIRMDSITYLALKLNKLKGFPTTISNKLDYYDKFYFYAFEEVNIGVKKLFLYDCCSEYTAILQLIIYSESNEPISKLVLSTFDGEGGRFSIWKSKMLNDSILLKEYNFGWWDKQDKIDSIAKEKHLLKSNGKIVKIKYLAFNL